MSASKRNLAWLLIVVGGLMALTAGSCVIPFGGLTLLAFISSGGREGGDYLAAILVIGGIPLVLGAFMAWWGRKLLLANPRPPDDRR